MSPKKDGSIERFQITPGEGHSTPNDGAYVEGNLKNLFLSFLYCLWLIFAVHLEGKHDGKLFETRDVSFNLGEGCESKVIEGVEKALEKFKKGEVSRLVIKPKHAFGAEGNSELGIPPNAIVEYTVTLKTFEKVTTRSN